jgi:dGTPase
MGLNEDLAEALALVHDIGHPPFGHSGERTLDQMMQAFGEHFDHNLHALRIVETFEQRYADFPGLNLTFEVREGIIKHSRDYAPDMHPELSEYLLDQKPPLEAQVIDLADEIAYYIADLDDGYEAKLLSLDTLRKEIPLFERFFAPVQTRYHNAAPKLQFNETLKRMLDHLVTDLMETSLAEVDRLGITSVEAVRRQPRRLIASSAEAARDKSVLKKFLYQNLYQHPAFSAEREQGTQVVESLFQFYLDHPEKMPVWYASLAAEGRKHRVVCDYIAGMTDHYVKRLHRELVGGGKGESL